MRYALLHWRFFERFVNEDTHWLAPDNFQEDPEPVVAMRTSPTNIGLQLLATVSAYDLGFIPLDVMAGRLELVFRSLERMRRHQGHFFNWYDLRDLSVLEPAYVSTVDSGNLAGHLIALARRASPPSTSRCWTRAHAEPSRPRSRWRRSARAHTRRPPARRSTCGRRRRPSLRAPPPLCPRRWHPRSTTCGAPGRRWRRRSSTLGPHGLASEWITWGIGLLEGHAAWVEALSARPQASLRDLAGTSTEAARLVSRLEAIAERAYAYAMEMDFRFLFDAERKLFAIGYQQTSHSLDGSYYDLLASEARLASFIAIAKNDVSVEHWFRLGRTLTLLGGCAGAGVVEREHVRVPDAPARHALVPPHVLAQTYDGAVSRQRTYGAERGVPWGVSESAYNVRDRHHTYQYRAFGVPDLALKRGLGRDLVDRAVRVAPRAHGGPPSPRWRTSRSSSGSARSAPTASATRSTTPVPSRIRRFAVVRTYMAHHVGMGLVALTNVLAPLDLAAALPRRSRRALGRAAAARAHPAPARRCRSRSGPGPTPRCPRRTSSSRPCAAFDTPDTPQPHVALLGELPYTIMVSHAGGGYSRYESLAVTRWRADGMPRRDRAVLLRQGPVHRARVVRRAPAGLRAAPTGTTPTWPPTG